MAELWLFRTWHNGQETIAITLLRQCAEPEGMREPWSHHHSHTYVRQRVWLGELRSRGWAEIRNSGPRGGKRYHATEAGEVLLKSLDHHGHKTPEFRAAMMLIGATV